MSAHMIVVLRMPCKCKLKLYLFFLNYKTTFSQFIKAIKINFRTYFHNLFLILIFENSGAYMYLPTTYLWRNHIVISSFLYVRDVF